MFFTTKLASAHTGDTHTVAACHEAVHAPGYMLYTLPLARGRLSRRADEGLVFLVSAGRFCEGGFVQVLHHDVGSKSRAE